MTKADGQTGAGQATEVLIDMSAMPSIKRHYAPRNLRDRIAFGFIRLLRLCADLLFARRYGHRAVVLETVAAVPGMVGGALQHLRALRRMESDHGCRHRDVNHQFANELS